MAFFDVDHTVIAGSSLAGFFGQLTRDHADTELISAVNALQEEAPSVDHNQLVIRAIRLLRGQSWDLMRTVGEAWFKQHGESLFVDSVVRRLRWHQDRRDTIVFVSGSWLPSLAPIARTLGVHHILCCTPEQIAGCLTGEIPYVVVGDGKVRAIMEFAHDHPIDFAEAFAYGDDPTDIPMLELVAHPVAVGDNSYLREIAHARGWERLAN